MHFFNQRNHSINYIWSIRAYYERIQVYSERSDISIQTYSELTIIKEHMLHSSSPVNQLKIQKLDAI